MGEEFAVGSRVSARGLAWDVLEMAPLGAQTLLRLRCTDGDLDGLEWDILHPAEPIEMGVRNSGRMHRVRWRRGDFTIRPACSIRCLVRQTCCWAHQVGFGLNLTSSFR